MLGNTIKRKVHQIIKKYKTRDPFELVTLLDVILLYVPLVDIIGFYNYYNNTHIIYINENMSRDEQRITLAHELGHLFLHKDINVFFLNTATFFSSQKLEREADIFASELLISDKDILRNGEMTTRKLASLLRVSEKHIIYKFNNLEGVLRNEQSYKICR